MKQYDNCFPEFHKFCICNKTTLIASDLETIILLENKVKYE